MTKPIGVLANGTLVRINTEKAWGIVEIPGTGTAIMLFSKLTEEDRDGLVLGSTVTGLVSTSFKDGAVKRFFERVDSVEARIVLGSIKNFVDNPAKKLCFGKLAVVSEPDLTEVHLPVGVLLAQGVTPIVGTPLMARIVLGTHKGKPSWTATEVRFDEAVVAAYREEQAAAVRDVESVAGVTKTYVPGKFGFVVVDGRDCYLPPSVAEASGIDPAVLGSAGNAVKVLLKPVPKGYEVTAIVLETVTEPSPEGSASDPEAPPEVAKEKKVVRRKRTNRDTSKADVSAMPPAPDGQSLAALISKCDGDGLLAAALKQAAGAVGNSQTH